MPNSTNHTVPPAVSRHIMRKLNVVDDRRPKRKKELGKNEKEQRKKQAKFNAVTTGVYATGPLPWESREEFKSHCDQFVKLYEPIGYIEHGLVLDMALNRWRRKRTRLMTSVAMNRHGFGRALMTSGPQSWQEVETFLGDFNVETKQTLERIGNSIAQVLKIGTQIEKKCFDTDEVSKFMQELAETCTNCCELLESTNIKLDLEREFFDQYMPKNLEEMVRAENALDAQFDKMHSRLQVVQEARLRRDALSLRQPAAAVIVPLGKPADPEKTQSESPSSNDGATALGAPDDKAGQPSADGAGDQEDLLADDGDPNESDPLTEFVAEQADD